MAKVTVDGVEGEYMPHEVISLMHAGKITSEECRRALGMEGVKLNLIFENDGSGMADQMTPDEFATKMKEVFASDEYSVLSAHMRAEEVICKLLKSLGYGKGVETFEQADKWWW